jgi:hypothetical protein
MVADFGWCLIRIRMVYCELWCNEFFVGNLSLPNRLAFLSAEHLSFHVRTAIYHLFRERRPRKHVVVSLRNLRLSKASNGLFLIHVSLQYCHLAGFRGSEIPGGTCSVRGTSSLLSQLHRDRQETQLHASKTPNPP